MAREQFVQLVADSYRRAIDELGGKIVEPVGESTALFGPESMLDSIALVSVVLDIEQRLDEEADVKVRLMDERALSRRHSPFRSIGTLVDYVTELREAERT